MREDGTFANQGGEVCIDRGIDSGYPCPCGCSPKHWLSISTGMDTFGEMEIISITGEAKEIEDVKRIIEEATRE